MKLWYMQDNHLFLALPVNVEEAIELLRSEFADGNTYGMLCQDEPRSHTVCHARADFNEFEPRARAWLTSAIAYRSPADLEYESWLAA